MSGVGIVNLVVSIPITLWVSMRIDDNHDIVFLDTAEEYTQHQPDIYRSESNIQLLG